jgi:hypothetical protein
MIPPGMTATVAGLDPAELVSAAQHSRRHASKARQITRTEAAR